MKPTFILCAALTCGTFLTSCVDPYYAGPPATTTTTVYRSGYEVRSLPSGYRTVTVDGERYYSHNGTYYRPRSGRYVVVDAPRGYREDRPHNRYRGNDRGPRRDATVIRELPPGYRAVKYRGRDYYQVRDTYYQRSGPGYVIVNRPY